MNKKLRYQLVKEGKPVAEETCLKKAKRWADEFKGTVRDTKPKRRKR